MLDGIPVNTVIKEIEAQYTAGFHPEPPASGSVGRTLRPKAGGWIRVSLNIFMRLNLKLIRLIFINMKTPLI